MTARRQPRSAGGRHRPARPPLAAPTGSDAERGRRCSSSTASASTPAATSTSATQLAAAGVDAWAYDHRGQRRLGGAPGPRRSLVASSTTTSASGSAPSGASADGRPVVLYGHSLGGLIVAGYLLDDDRADGRSRTSWSCRRPASTRRWPAGSRRWPRSWPGRADPRRPERHRRLDAVAGPDRRRERPAADPLNGERRARPGSGPRRSPSRRGSAGGAARLRAADARAPRPRRRARPAAGVRGASRARPNVERRTYPGLRHELHNEPEGPAIVADVIAWLRDRA